MKPINDSTIIICSIVRNAEKGLRRNIPVIKDLCRYFADYKIIVYENDSKDGTKQLLCEWTDSDNGHVTALLDDIGEPVSIPPIGSTDGANPFYSRKRIVKMAALRNQYMEYVDKQRLVADYLMVVDLDVARLNLDAILTSFTEDAPHWDAVTAFGYSTSPELRRRYHDTYALVEQGHEDKPQTEQEIKRLAKKYGKLYGTKEWRRIYSGFGGLAIYRFEVIKGLRYHVLRNGDCRVEVKCEHYSIYKQMAERGFADIYLNPSMTLKYQNLTFIIILKSMIRLLRKRFGGGKNETSVLTLTGGTVIVKPLYDKCAA